MEDMISAWRGMAWRITHMVACVMWALALLRIDSVVGYLVAIPILGGASTHGGHDLSGTGDPAASQMRYSGEDQRRLACDRLQRSIQSLRGP